MEDDPIYDIHSEEYIDDLIHITIQRGLFKDVEDAIKSIKALAKMVISSKTSIDAFMKCPVPNIPNAFYDLVYTELLVMLPASVIHEAWIRLTTRKRSPLSVSDASGVNSMVELFLKHEVERYQKKLARQRLTVKQTYMPRNRMTQDMISEEVAILQKHLLEYNKVTFGQFIQNLTREHEKLIETNHQIQHEIDTMKKQ
ncbi:2269_t:CDS:2, partial [Rhizophagus irregularis]